MTSAKQAKAEPRKKTTSFLEGPAIRRALEMAEEEASRNEWKLLEPPPEAGAAGATEASDPWKVLEPPADNVASTPEEFVDPTQPEASWKVVDASDPKQPPADKPKTRLRTQRSAPEIARARDGAKTGVGKPVTATKNSTSRSANVRSATGRGPARTTQTKPHTKPAVGVAARSRFRPALESQTKRKKYALPEGAPARPKPVEAAPARPSALKPASVANANLGRNLAPAAQVPRPDGGVPRPRPRMATLMGVQPSELERLATRPAPPSGSAVPGVEPHAAEPKAPDPSLAATMLAGPSALPPNATTTTPEAAAAPAAGPARAKNLRATMMGVAPPPLLAEASAPNEMAATMLAGPTPLPAAQSAASGPTASRESFADTILAGVSPVATNSARKSVAPPPPQVPPSPAELAAIPPPLPGIATAVAAPGAPQQSTTAQSANPTPTEGAATQVADGTGGAVSVQGSVAAAPLPMRDNTASEPSLSGLARNSVPPARSLMRSPWVLALAGIVVLAVPVTGFALLKSGASSDEPTEVSQVHEVRGSGKAHEQAARPEAGAKASTPSKAAPTEKPQASSKSAPAKAQVKTERDQPAKPKEKAEVEARPEVGHGTPIEIPWKDIDPVSAKGCEDLVDVSAGASATAFKFSQAFKAAKLAMLRGEVDAAHQAFCQASLLSKPNAPVLTGLAQVLLIKGDLTAALEAADQLLRLKHESASAMNLRGDILIRMGEVDEALNAWMSAAGATRLSAILKANLFRASDQSAREALQAGDLARADRLLRRALAIEPGNAEIAARLALVLHKNENDRAARLWLRYASSLDADHPLVTRLRETLS